VLHEAYHARWDKQLTDPGEQGCWRLEIPLIMSEQSIGRLELTGPPQEHAAMLETFQAITQLAQQIEKAISRQVADGQSPVPVPTSPLRLGNLVPSRIVQ
jgi:hypothetical protein